MGELEPKISTYLHNKGAKMGIPVSGTFELTRKCNFNCKMCYVHCTDTSNDRELSAEEWLKIAGEAKKAGLLFLLLTGGEPLLRPDFELLYTELSKMGFMISINTNGSIITPRVFRLFEEYPPARVNISLYGGSEDTYKNLCENRNFEKVLENIKKLKEMKISVRLNCVFNRYNVADTEEIYRFAKENDLIIKPTSYMYPSLRAKGETGDNEARLSAVDAAKNTVLCRKLTFSEEQLRQKAKEMMSLYPPECDPDAEGEGMRCRAGKSSFWLTYDGRMMPCGMMTEPCVSLADMSFSEAWQYIRQKTSEIRLPSECQKCTHKSVCNVCAAMCYTETGRFDGKPDYICDMVKCIADEFVNQFGEVGEANEDKI